MKPKSKLGLQIFLETILQTFIFSNLQKQIIIETEGKLGY
jgi:hypothetical protein